MANSNGWGDGSANNAIGWGQGAVNNSNNWGDSHAKSWAGLTDIVGITTDPAASAYFTATGITGATQQQAIDTLVKSLKSNNIWSKMKAVYPFVTDNRNLLSYTEDFGNAYWAKNNSTITANSTLAPNGTNTADSLVDNSTNDVHSIAVQQTLTNAAYTYSIYCKKANRDWVWLALYDGTTSRFAYFNLVTGTIGNVDSGATATITDATNGWYRCTLSMPMTTSVNNYVNTGAAIANGSFSYIGNSTAAIYLWGAQLELGSTATTYQPISTTQQAFISNQFKYNLVNPVDSDAAFRLVFNGGWTHSANGATPNGVNAYADTKLNDLNDLGANATIGCYLNLSGANSEWDLGIYTPPNIVGISVNNSGNTYVNIKSSVNISFAEPTFIGGLYLGTTNGTNSFSYKNATLQNTVPQTTTGLNFNHYIGALNNSGVSFLNSSKRNAFTFFANETFTSTNISNLYTAVQAFQTSLSRQV